MSIKRPVPSHPINSTNKDEWDRWHNIISQASVHIVDFDVVINPASIAANTTAEQTFTVNGLGVNDIPLTLIKPTATAGVGIVGLRTSAVNTLAVTFVNATAGPIDPPSETYKLVVIRQ
jgi:hypothetical protein